MSASNSEELPQPRLDALPEELVSNIAARLDFDDVSQLRLTCKTVEAKCFHDFATEFFSGKAFMLSSESLKTLLAIAESERLQGNLKTVYVTSALFSDSAFMCGNGCHCAWQPTTRQSEAYKYYINDQKQLKETGEDRDLLVKSLKQLGHVKTLRLCDSTHGADHVGLPIHGLRKVHRRCGRKASFAPMSTPGQKPDKEFIKWTSHVWKTLCKAIAESGVTIERFGVAIDETVNGLGVADLKLSPKTMQGLSAALENVTDITLTIRESLIRSGGTHDRDASVQVMRNFGKMIQNTKEIKLSFDGMKSSGILASGLLKKLDLQSLTKLWLDGASTTASALTTIIGGLQSIKDLQLSFCDLSSGTWIPVLETLKKLGDLQHLHLMWLLENGRKAFFLPPREDDEFADEWADTHPDDEDSDDEIPDLEPVQDHEQPPGHPPATDAAPTSTAENEAAASSVVHNIHTACDDGPAAASNYDFEAPGYEGQGERGYYVCLASHDEITKYLPIFIKEYNLGDDVNAPFPFMPGGGPGVLPGGPGGAVPAGVGALLNNIFGGPPPPPGPGAGAGAGGAPPNAAHGHAHGHGPPPAFFTVGNMNGPGYTMAMGMGTFPMHAGPHGGAGGQNSAPAGAGAGGAGGGGGGAGPQGHTVAGAQNAAPNGFEDEWEFQSEGEELLVDGVD